MQCLCVIMQRQRANEPRQFLQKSSVFLNSVTESLTPKLVYLTPSNLLPE